MKRTLRTFTKVSSLELGSAVPPLWRSAAKTASLEPSHIEDTVGLRCVTVTA